jgi:hypothetical protein
MSQWYIIARCIAFAAVNGEVATVSKAPQGVGLEVSASPSHNGTGVHRSIASDHTIGKVGIFRVRKAFG